MSIPIGTPCYIVRSRTPANVGRVVTVLRYLDDVYVVVDAPWAGPPPASVGYWWGRVANLCPIVPPLSPKSARAKDLAPA